MGLKDAIYIVTITLRGESDLHHELTRFYGEAEHEMLGTTIEDVHVEEGELC